MNEFQCEICGSIFEKGLSDEQAKAEHQSAFPHVPIEDCGLVCDTCWKTKIVPMLS